MQPPQHQQLQQVPTVAGDTLLQQDQDVSTEVVTASNWASLAGGHPHSSTHIHSSGVLFPGGFSTSSGSSSKHMGFFGSSSSDINTKEQQQHSAPVPSVARPRTADLATRHHLYIIGEQQQGAGAQHPGDQHAEQQQKMQEWLQFQHDAPQHDSTSHAQTDRHLVRSSSSPEPNLRSHHRHHQHLEHNSTSVGGHGGHPSSAGVRQLLGLVASESQPSQPQKSQPSQPEHNNSSLSRRSLDSRQPAPQQATARKRLPRRNVSWYDGTTGGGADAAGGGSDREGPHEGHVGLQQQAAWQFNNNRDGEDEGAYVDDMAPAGPDRTASFGAAGGGGSGGGYAHTADAAQLLMHLRHGAHNSHQHQQQQEWQQQQQHQERPASTPPASFFQQQHQEQQGYEGQDESAWPAWRPQTPQGAGGHQQHGFGHQRPHSPLLAAIAGSGGPNNQAYLGGGAAESGRHRPYMLSPEASAAAADAVTAIRRAMAAVDAETQQLQLLQGLMNERRRLQAVARASVARATAAAAACAAGPAAAAAGAGDGVGVGVGVGRQGSIGSSSVGSSVGNSSSGSTHTTACTTGSLGGGGGGGSGVHFVEGVHTFEYQHQQHLQFQQTAHGGVRWEAAGGGQHVHNGFNPGVLMPGGGGGAGGGGGVGGVYEGGNNMQAAQGFYGGAGSGVQQHQQHDELHSEFGLLALDEQQLLRLQQTLQLLRQP